MLFLVLTSTNKMDNKTINSECLHDSRSRALFLDYLWEMSDDVDPETIREAAKEARRIMFETKDRELASVYREVMDSLFTLFIYKTRGLA